MIASPLRYPGGKAKLFPFFAELIRSNRITGVKYCEPYAGGAGLALKLLSAGLVDCVYLNDIDEAVWAFWWSALHQNSELCSLVEAATLTLEEWYRQREIWRQKDVTDPLRLGFATFYLNRTNRSGIIEGAGPVGGYSQTGPWRLNARFDPLKQAAAVRSLAPFRAHITLSHLDALDFLDMSLNDEQALTYLDPPYYVKGSKLYRNSYIHDDHIAVRDAVIKARGGKWVVSYDSVAPILNMYRGLSPIFYSLAYSAGPISRGSEVIYLSDGLSLPDVSGFIQEAA